ncbi:DUF488 domain-containing protein (plasmid) [Arthrobacter agilis]|uniref:DUF488 domain-containing protein n=1 Tax=Arthrobacter agilis TaxID=37921 RepID=UPI002365EFBF|nr:DUF488 domain-containing protein [Arthrobacter agilis]WDF35112.1 DUF488 domain-containing protein [Arthrobacter agilis]
MNHDADPMMGQSAVQEAGSAADQSSSRGSIPGRRLMTIGHGTASQEELTTLLIDAGVRALVDVRIGPGSRKFPHVNKDAMERWLPEHGIDYLWAKDLGGFRKLLPGSPDTSLRNQSFRGYAGYMRTPGFISALETLLAQASAIPTVIMCSETLWWRCHRRLISDNATLLHDTSVQHLISGSRTTNHQPTRGVRVQDKNLVYDGPL